MFELGKFSHRRSSELRQAGSVKLLARNRQDEIARIDQRGEHHHAPFGLQAQALGCQVFDPVHALHQFGAVEHLAMPLLFQQIDNVRGILRAVWIETFAIQQFERIEHSRGLPGTVLPGNGPQRILRRLVSVSTVMSTEKDG